MLGCLFLKDLRREREKELGSRFKAGEFHRSILRLGLVGLETLKSRYDYEAH
jgi:uncharacterized protein (DUF885 family)